MGIQTGKTEGGMGEQNTESVANETTPAVPTEPADDDPSLDVVFGILSNQRRRLTLGYLRANDGLADISDLAEYVAAVENDKPIEAVDSTERKRVYVGLYQSHLPKMDDAGVVSFDQDRGTIATSEKADIFHEYLSSGTGNRSWPLYYLGLSIVGVLTVALSISLNGVDLASLLTAGLVAVLLTITLGHVYVELFR